MENYAYTASYAESGDSSPRSRENDFETPPPWDDQPQPTSANYKAKFMCSYGGKIHPRPHDNQLSYVGGETKILAVDRTVKFSAFISKLAALCGDADVCFKYQLPGEDLDALISVTNDDDLEHMMNEYDRLYRASPKPARLRLFLFPANSSLHAQSSFGSGEKSDRERFVDALNSAPIHSSPPPQQPPNHMDFLFGLDNKSVQPPPAVPVTAPVAMKLHDQVLEPPPSDPIFQRQIQDLQRLQIGGQEQQQATYRKKSDDNIAGGFPGDYYMKKIPEKIPPATSQMSVPATVSVPGGYWPEKQIVTGGFPATTPGNEQQVYMIPNPASMYHAPMSGRPVTGPPGQGYYAMQRMPPEAYREQPVYNMAPPSVAAQQPTLPPQQQPKVVAYSEGFGMVRQQSSGAGVGVTDMGYAQVAYDSRVGRPVYYTAPGGVMPPGYQVPVAVNAEMRTANTLSHEGKVAAAKISQT